MDKYTVDLDQVLNDFEYNELTTEQPTKFNRNTQNTTNSYYSAKNSSQKHSINNVFHSLNEYLNSDINSKTSSTLPATTTTPPVIQSQPSPTITATTTTTTKEQLPIINSNVCILDTTSPILIPPLDRPLLVNDNNFSNSLNSSPIINKSNEELIIDKKTDNFVVVKDYNNDEKLINLDKKENSNNFNEDVTLSNKEEVIENNNKIEIKDDEDEFKDCIDDNIKDISNVNNEEILDNLCVKVKEKITENESLLNDEIIVEESTKTESNVEKEEIISEVVTELKNNKTVEEKEIEEKTLNEVIENEIKDEKIEQETSKEIKQEIKQIKPIGFDDYIDSDESELNNYLEELEKEYDSQQMEVLEETHNNNIKDKEEEEESDVIKVELEEVNEEKKDEIKEEHEKVEEIKRPVNLPLLNDNKETKEEVRKIDLIGDPGSTPYNNVYITKELPKEEEEEKEKVGNGNKEETITRNKKIESDTECSTSASPTFSDISTETTSSFTPSNDTIEQLSTTNGTCNNETIIDLTQPQLNIPTTPNNNALQDDESSVWLGKLAPLWIPDSDAINCLHCSMKFTVIKRRHHCRACGLVLCSKCCNLKLHLEYLDSEARVCNKCYEILTKQNSTLINDENNEINNTNHNTSLQKFKPNPNNPLEYCSTVPPYQQVDASGINTPPSVMVPVGVLKRKGSKGKTNKSVMFCDGIRPGSDLTNLDNDFSYNNDKIKTNQLQHPVYNQETKSFIPDKDTLLPPIVKINKNDFFYSDVENDLNLTKKLKDESIIFVLQLNLLVHVKIVDMNCCINKTAWCFTTEGLINVGQDEIIILLEIENNDDDDDELLPKDIFLHINNLYLDGVKGITVKEMGVSLHLESNFLNSKNHAGFIYIKPTFQCLQNIIKPLNEPYLIGILIHRWEIPWAKLFPLRLILRLGAEYRYYPSPIISTRYRDSVYVEIGHTIINLLADFRNFSYTLPQIRGLTIHMEDKNTTLTIPINRYDQIMKSINNSSDHILAFAGNFSNIADSHLVCIQDTQSNENSYSTHAINIQNKPRKVTGASFIVFNGALKSSSGLTAKSSIVEDGLMVQIPSEHMQQIRDSLKNMKNYIIQCGCINAKSDETVNIIWGDADNNFNIGIESPIDGKTMNGIPSIRVHNGKDFISQNGNRLIRWTEVFIIQNGEEIPSRNQEPVDISKISENIAKATCTALVKYIDLLISNNFNKIALRSTLHIENVSYLAGSNGIKLPPIYMKSLDNELIPVLHRIVSNNFCESAIVLELIFRILKK